MTGISKHCMEKTLTELFGQPNRIEGLPRWLRGKELTANAGDVGSISRSGRSPGGGNGNPSVSLPGNPMNRGAWQATVHGVARESDMT